MDVGVAKWTETQTTSGTLKFNYTQTEFLKLMVGSIYLDEAELHWKLSLIFTIFFFYYILLYTMYKKYIIICAIIYSLVCVLNYILFAGRLYFVDVTYYIKVSANETRKLCRYVLKKLTCGCWRSIEKCNHRWTDNIQTDLED